MLRTISTLLGGIPTAFAISGQKGRDKLLLLYGLTADEAAERLA